MLRPRSRGAASSTASQQTLEDVHVPDFVTGLVALVDVADLAAAIDEHAVRHGLDGIGLRDGLCLVEHKRKRHSRTFSNLPGLASLGLDIDPEHRETQSLVALMNLIKPAGAHQLAQKFRSTTWPRYSSSRRLSPASAGSVKSGAASPSVTA